MQTECGFHTLADGQKVLVEKGPTILVDVGFDTNFNPTQSNSIPVPLITNIEALVDTGAQKNYIDTVLATTLKLPIVDRMTLVGSVGAHPADVYLAQIHVPALNEVLFGQFAGVNLIKGGLQHGAILGREFLQKLEMKYDGLTGRVILTKSEEKD